MVDKTESPFAFTAGELSENIPQDKLLQTGRVNKAEDILERITRSLGNGSLASAITTSFWGHNHRGAGNPVPLNNEQHGLTFITRPNLDLSYDNIKFFRPFNSLLAEDPNSIQRAIRAYLDPEGSRRDYKSNLVDPLNPFIPLLENNLASLSGWPDIVVDKYTSKEGMYKEQTSMVDGVPHQFQAYSLTANFRNILRDPITYLFYVWTQYSLLVHEGTLDPRIYSTLENEIDYMSRFYRLTTDPARQYVYRVTCCGAMFPITNPVGAAFNFSSDEKYVNRDLDQITIEFQAIGARPYDTINMKDFNTVVEIFNPNMREGRRQAAYEYIPLAFRYIFNNKGYPRINLETSELEWWISREEYENGLRGIVDPSMYYYHRR